MILQKIKEKEENIILNNNKIFIKSFHQINELLKLLNKISQKGSFFIMNEKESILIMKIKILF